MPKRSLIAVLMMLMLSACGNRACCAESDSDSLEQLGANAIRTVSSRIRLGATTLAEVAPRYDTGEPMPLPWVEALGEAERRFRNDPIKRAVFLCDSLVEGMDAACLAELRLPESGISSTQGSGSSKTFILEFGAIPATPHRISRSAYMFNYYPQSEIASAQAMVSVPVKATITLWIAHERIVNAPIISVYEMIIDDLEPLSYTFDRDRVLSSWQGGFVTADRDLSYGGNTSGEHGAAIYWNSIRANGASKRQTSFDGNLHLTSRTYYDSGNNPGRIEYFHAGVIRSIVHYQHDEQTNATVIERIEKF
jgi:hypothetical protein